MNNKGMTLIELAIVGAIVVILAYALGQSYVGWQGAYKVEKQTKDIYSDLMDARGRATTRAQEYFANFPSATTYEIRVDSDGNTLLDTSVDQLLPSFPKTVEYPVNISGGGTSVAFNRRGLMTPSLTICMNVDLTDADPSPSGADYDCIIVAPMRLNLGVLTTSIPDGGTCDAANCVAK